jgi:hypothetical protein
MYVSNVLEVYVTIHMDVAKIDGDVLYVAMVVHLCCKLLFLIFHLLFQTYVASVFIWILHMFHTYVASIFLDAAYVFTMVLSIFQVFLQMFQMYVSSVSSVFKCML